MTVPGGQPLSQLRMEVAQEDHELRTLLFGGGIKTTDGLVRGEDARLKVAAVLNRMMNDRIDLIGEIFALRLRAELKPACEWEVRRADAAVAEAESLRQTLGHPLGCDDCMEGVRRMVERGGAYLDRSVLCAEGQAAFAALSAADATQERRAAVEAAREQRRGDFL